MSGLLFREYQRHQKLRVGRFLLRRGFKIYPTFFFFLAVSIPLKLFYWHEPVSWPEFLAEFFFLQSYLPHVWGHTWSLAVEEHFYLAIALIAFIAAWSRSLQRKWIWLPLWIGACLLAFYIRAKWAYAFREFPMIVIFKTHHRMEGLIIGLLISYLYYFSPGFAPWLTRNRRMVLLTSLALISPLFFWAGGSYLMTAYGHTLIHWGFAGLILLTVVSDWFDNIHENPYSAPFAKTLAWIGVYSYAIYVWHLFVRHVEDKIGGDGLTYESAYLLLSIFLGAFLSWLIEYPLLRVRDRLFPRPAQAKLDEPNASEAEDQKNQPAQSAG